MTTKLNLVVNQGADFKTTFTMKSANGAVINLTSYTGASMLRRHYTSSNTVSFGVTLDALGNIVLSLTANTTTNIEPGRYQYDVKLTDGTGYASRVLEGLVNVRPSMTR